MPSGMLCSAMAIVRVIPSFIFVADDRNVATPSGMLCSIIAIMENIPTLNSLLFCFS